MTTDTASRLQAIRLNTIQDVKQQEFLTIRSPYATGDRSFLADCISDGVLKEPDAEMVNFFNDGLVTPEEIDRIDQGLQDWQVSA